MFHELCLVKVYFLVGWGGGGGGGYAENKNQVKLEFNEFLVNLTIQILHQMLQIEIYL